MKPLRLTINAFGTYSDKTEINFENFGNSGLYLISGDTGSGKTTIFDALSFALFGQASGSTRSNPKALRSDFAKDDNKTYVELEFLNRGEKYYIKRYCAHETINRNGKPKNEPEKAELIKPNNIVLSNLAEVNNEIVEILGIDKNQFSQIVMIAQGEFQRFLLAPTKEKEKIFRKIFKTKLYQDFQMRLVDKYKAEEKNKEKTEHDLKKDIGNIISSSDELEQMKNESNIYNLDELFEKLSKSIEKDKTNLNEYEKQFKTMREVLAQLNKDIKEAELIEKNKNDLEEIKKNLPLIQKEADNAQEEYEKEKLNDSKRKELSIQINKIQSDLKEYQGLDNKQKELEEKKEDLILSQNNLEKHKIELEKLKKEYDKSKKELENLKDLSGEIEKNKFEIEKYIAKKEELKCFLSKANEYQNKKEEFKKAKNEADVAEEYYQSQKQSAEVIYQKLRKNMAGALALELKEGKKCPVCGSFHHPEPAKISETQEDEINLEQAKQERDKAQKISTQKLNDAIKINEQLNSIQKELLEYSKDEFGMEALNEFEKTIKDALEKNEKNTKLLNSKKEELQEKQNKKEKLEKNIDNFEKTKKELDEKITFENNNQNILNATISSIIAIIGEKQKNLQYKTKQDAQINLAIKEQELSKSIKALEEKENNKNEKLRKLSEETGRKKELEEKNLKSKKYNLGKLKEELTQNNEIYEAKQKENNIINNRFETNNKLLSDIKKSKKEFENISDKLDMLNNLKRTANGELKEGRQKISFENYILGTYFNEIIQAANQRFKEMTSYQFELRKSQAKLGNAQTGLDLDVFDSYTTKIRNVSTLSGGESFKAALALSLGLSDIVQRRSGGVEIETMFIDEGFGSLDPESLEQTMKILQELSGNKTLIGIISHVTLLREKIENKITVTKTPKGSKLDIEIL